MMLRIAHLKILFLLESMERIRSMFTTRQTQLRLNDFPQRLQLPYFMSRNSTAKTLVLNWSRNFLQKFHVRGQIVDHSATPIDTQWVIEFPDFDSTILDWDNFSRFILDLVIKLSEIFTYEEWIGAFVYTLGHEKSIYYEFTNTTSGIENVKTLHSAVAMYQVGDDHITEQRMMKIHRMVPRRPVSPRRR